MIFPILSIAFLVLIHELGHYWVARHYGMAVKAFSIGFGPSWTLFTDRNGTAWKLSLIPLGGYVSFLSHEEWEVAHSTDFVGPPTQATKALRKLQGEAFEKVSLPKRLQVILAGPAVNFLAVYPLILGFVLLAPGSIKQNELVISKGIGQLIEDINSSEYKNYNLPDLKTGDRISEINGMPVLTPEGIKGSIAMAKLQGMESVDIIVDKRYATEHEYEMTLLDAEMYFNVVDYQPSPSTSNAYRIVLHDIFRISVQGFLTLPAVLHHQYSNNPENQAADTSSPESFAQSKEKIERVSKVIDSPIMMVKNQSNTLSKINTTSKKVAFLLLAAGTMSLGLALLNLIPLSFFDGGQVIVNILSGAKEEGFISSTLHGLIMITYNLLSLFCLGLLFILSIGGDIFELLT